MSTPIPKWFKPVSFAITIWMALGLLMFFMDIMAPADQVAALPEAQRTLREARPLWLMIDFGIATFVGLMGGVAHALGLPGFVFAMGAASLWVAIKAKNAGWLSH